MKTKADKKVNKIAKQLNKSIAADVFGNRFWARQVKKERIDGISFYLYELVDRLQPERNRVVYWESEFALIKFHHLDIAMNNFIIESDFWSKYKKGE